MISHQKLTGLIAAPHTPFTVHGDLNLAAIDRQAEILDQDGVSGVFIGGTTGECHSLSVDERLRLAERWSEALTGSRLKLIVHVGSQNLPDSRELAKQAGNLENVVAMGAMAPSFFKPPRPAEVAAWLRDVASYAPELPTYYYDIPAMTGIRLPMGEILTLCMDTIPNFAGLKLSNPDMTVLVECMTFSSSSLDVLFGCDEAFLFGYAAGVKGAVGSSYNIAAPLYLRIMSAFDRGDHVLARADQTTSVAMVNLLASHGYLPASKFVMSLKGVDCGPVRLPLRNLDDDARNRIAEGMEKLGLIPQTTRAV
ncbi:N-acetylneuraminate lyase [bacterium]|nr:N-acetylneuraminate lyase [bacterium]